MALQSFLLLQNRAGTHSIKWLSKALFIFCWLGPVRKAADCECLIEQRCVHKTAQSGARNLCVQARAQVPAGAGSHIVKAVVLEVDVHQALLADRR